MISEKELLHEIEELENKTPTYQVCEKLSTLYIVYDHFYGEHTTNYSYASAPEPQPEPKTKEKKEILPAYSSYVEAKRNYQHGDASKEKVLKKLKNLSTEIKDFLIVMYRNTDFPEERDVINQLINDVNVGNF